MKRWIQKLCNMYGYRLCKLSEQGREEDAFANMQYLLRHVESPIIFDIGAHRGDVSRVFRRLFPASTVYAFEPFKESFELLRANTVADSKIKAFNFGLCDRSGMQPFYSNTSSATNSLLPADAMGSRTWGAGLLDVQSVVSAEFKTIDAVVEEMRIPRIDILKMDVQGAEHLVMAGASTACKNGLISLAYTEIITQPTYVDQRRFDEALAPFYNNGFDLHNIYNMSQTPEGKLRQIDAIFTKVEKEG